MRMRPFLKAFLLAIATSLGANESAVTLVLERPPVYVLDAPFDATVNELPRLGEKGLPDIGDLRSAKPLLRLSSIRMEEELQRLRERHGQITEALYRQRYFSHKDENELPPWNDPNDRLSPDAEKVLWRLVTKRSILDFPSNRPTKQSAARVLELINSLTQPGSPTGPGLALLTEASEELRAIEAGPYQLEKVRSFLLEATKATLKSTATPRSRLSERKVPLIQVDPYRNQELEVNSPALLRGPLPGLERAEIVLPRLSSFEPSIIQTIIDYWEMSADLGVYTTNDMAFLAKPSPFALDPVVRLINSLKADQKKALSIRTFWIELDKFHALATQKARSYFRTPPPHRRMAHYWQVFRWRDRDEGGLQSGLNELQAKWDKEYEQGINSSKQEIVKELAAFNTNIPPQIVSAYGELINNLKYKTAELPSVESGEMYLEDFHEFIRSTELARFADPASLGFVEDDASVPSDARGPVATAESTSYRPLQLFEYEIPYDVDRLHFPDALGQSPPLELFRWQERVRAASVTSRMSRYRPPVFYRVVDEIRVVRAARRELDSEQSQLADRLRQERDQIMVAYRLMRERFAEGNVAPPVAGRIVGLYIQRGSVAKAGAPLLSLSPFFNYTARWCDSKIGQVDMQPGMVIDVRLKAFERHPEINAVFKEDESLWISQFAPAFSEYPFRIIVNEDQSPVCGAGKRGWRLSVQPVTRHPILRLRVTSETRAPIVRIVERLGWRYFMGIDDLTVAVDGPIIDERQPVTFSLPTTE